MSLLAALLIATAGSALAAHKDAASKRPASGAAQESPFKSGFEEDPCEEINDKVSSLYEAGKFEQALPLAREALKLAESKYGRDGAAVARPLNNLAWLLQATGDYSEARPLFERALAINESTLGQDDPEVATSLNNLAALLSFQGDAASARPLYERALTIQEKSLGPYDPALGDTLNNLAVVFESTGHPEAALPLYERALSITEKSLGTEHADVATSINNLASVQERLGNLSSAATLFERALAIRQKTLPPDHPDLAESLNNLALVRISQGDTASARDLLARALRVNQASLGPHHPYVASTLNNLGKLDWQEGKTEEARTRFLAAAKIINEHVGSILPSLSFAEQRAFLVTKVPEEISILLSTCREGSSLAEAYDYILRWKGLLIETLRWQKAVSALAQKPEYRSKVSHLQNLRTAIAAWYHEAGTVPYAEWKKKNDRLTGDKESVERELARALKPGNVKDILSDRSAADFFGLLKPDELLIDIYRYQAIGNRSETTLRYGAVLSRHTGPQAFIDFGPTGGADAALAAWRRQVVVKNEGAAEWQTLRDIFWKPVAGVFPQDVRKVWLSPDSQLARLPWHLMPEGDKLTGHVMLSQLDSGRELAYLRLINRPARSGSPLFLVAGGIDFGGDSGQGGKTLSLPALPGTLKEAQQLKAMAGAKGFKVSLLTGRDANKANILGALPSASWIHLATHGFFFDESKATSGSSAKTSARAAGSAVRNPLIESGIALSGEAGGRFLTAEELVGLSLPDAELITLSACETGLGETASGQGVLGLRASIMAAGARCILMSLWKVPDESTLLLMQEFYNNLWAKKLTTADALKQAQQTVRNQPYDRFAAPIYWAAWVLVGEAW